MKVIRICVPTNDKARYKVAPLGDPKLKYSKEEVDVLEDIENYQRFAETVLIGAMEKNGWNLVSKEIMFDVSMSILTFIKKDG